MILNYNLPSFTLSLSLNVTLLLDVRFVISSDLEPKKILFVGGRILDQI